MKLSTAKEILSATLKQNLKILAENGHRNNVIVPYMQSAPGCGKTECVMQVGEDIGARVEEVRLCDRQPNEVGGWHIPNNERTEMTQVKPGWLPDPKEGPVILFLDELPQAATMVQNAAAQIVNERRIGAYELPNNTVIVAAGNPMKMRAGTNHMPTHLRDRLSFLTIDPDADDVARYFQKIGADFRVVGYLRNRPDMLSNFDKDADACPSPRSWQRVSSILQIPMPEAQQVQAISGTVGKEAAVDFQAYVKLAKEMPDINEVLRNPDKAPVPKEAGVLYALCAALSPRVSKEHAPAISRYLKRIERKEISAFVMADAYYRDENVIQIAEVREWFVTDGREIMMSK